MTPRFTPREIERSIDALVALRGLRRQPWEVEFLRPRLGGSGRPVLSSLEELAALGLLISDAQGTWSLTERGEQAIDARAAGNWSPLVEITMVAGGLEREIEAFLIEAETEGGDVRLHTSRARRVAPALCAVLSWRSEWRDGASLCVPRSALDTAMAEAAMQIAEGRSPWVAELERVGYRAEAYSLRLEREQHGAHAVTHVSADDDGDRFGYDIEESSSGFTRRIEAKGSRSGSVTFTLSESELGAAQAARGLYEIQFWGDIDLATAPRHEYVHLRNAGYPAVLQDPAGMIKRGELNAVAAGWRCALAQQ